VNRHTINHFCNYTVTFTIKWTDGEDEKCVKNFGSYTSIGDRMGDLGVDQRTVLKWILEKLGCEGMNWIQLIEDMVQLWTFMNTVINLWVP
jgi:hypothetical protein